MSMKIVSFMAVASPTSVFLIPFKIIYAFTNSF